MNALKPRRATRDDRPAIVALQHAAYAKNRAILGVEPLPLQADYDDIFARHECWVLTDKEALTGALFLELRADDLLIWSIAAHPDAQGFGAGRALLAFADARARELGRITLRLYTGEALTSNVAWYARNGFVVERREDLPDRRVVHMKKNLSGG